MTILLYVALGILSDALVTGYYLCVSRGWVYRAALISIPIPLLSFWVLDRVIMTASWDSAVAYAVGNALGCFVIMKAARWRAMRT